VKEISTQLEHNASTLNEPISWDPIPRIHDKTDSPKHNSGEEQQMRFDLNRGILKAPIIIERDSHRIHGRNRLEKFLHGVKDCKAITYVIGLDFIEQYLEEIGIQRLTLIVGKEVSAARRKSMDPEFIKKLARWQSEGRLNIRVPIKGEMHEKSFFCWNHEEKWFMDLNGSANPTKSGSGGRGQSNRITTTKITGDYEKQEYYKKCMTQWDWYLEKSIPFLDSLIELLPDDEEEWVPTIVRWLEADGDVELESMTEIRVIQQEIGMGLLETSISGKPEYIMSIEGYNEGSVDKAVELMNKRGFGIERMGGILNTPVSALDVGLKSIQAAPMMSLVDNKLWLRIGGKNFCRTADILPPEEIEDALIELEKYICSVENAHRGDLRAKMALAEFITAVISSPFDYLYMKERRNRFSRLREGPRMTSYYGTAGNGKSYACRYALKMLSGQDMEALSSKSFTKSAVMDAASSGSCFPLLFDDLQRDRVREWGDWGKFYWDTGYNNSTPYPQLIITANDRIDSGGSLGRRVREIAMHASYTANEDNSVSVEHLLEHTSNLFLYFSKLMIEDWVGEKPNYRHGDELSSGRITIQKLYKIAKRKQPKWWPKQPVEKIHDDQAHQWLDLINKDVVHLQIERDEIIARFDNTAPGYEVNRKRKLLPTFVGGETSGTKVRIRNPAQFIEWINAAKQVYSSPIKRKTKRLLKRRFI
jgi:hypothetical protein